MENLRRDIEKSTRNVFRVFFGSRLYLKNDNEDRSSSRYGVDLMMDCNGQKRMSLMLEEDTIKSVMRKLTGDDDIFRERVAYDIIGEMASIIACNALNDTSEKLNISDPRKTKNRKFIGAEALTFSSKLGKFTIAIKEI